MKAELQSSVSHFYEAFFIMRDCWSVYMLLFRCLLGGSEYHTFEKEKKDVNELWLLVQNLWLHYFICFLCAVSLLRILYPCSDPMYFVVPGTWVKGQLVCNTVAAAVSVRAASVKWFIHCMDIFVRCPDQQCIDHSTGIYMRRQIFEKMFKLLPTSMMGYPVVSCLNM